MRGLTLLTTLILAVVLVLVTPLAALAAKPVPMSATGAISQILPGTVGELGNSGRWRVAEREVRGSLSGDISGDFVLTYKANVALETQAGNFQGVLESGSYSFKVNGKIQPLEMVLWYGVWLPKLTISGHWVSSDPPGRGTFDAWCIFIPYDGHVGMILASSFAVNGEWQQP